MVKKQQSELRKQIHAMHEENEYRSIIDNRGRSRSITVGTAFGGAVEIIMRNEFSTMYAIMQPVEAVEFMEQIAAGCGIEIAMRPKQNFTSWRGWSVDADSPDAYVKGSAPYQIEGQEFNRKLQALREDMHLEIERAKIELEKEKQLKKLKGTVSKNNVNLLPESKKEIEEETPQKPKNSRKKSTPKVEETNDN